MKLSGRRCLDDTGKSVIKKLVNMKRKGRWREATRESFSGEEEEVTQQQREHMRRNKPREKKLNCVTMSSLLATFVLTFSLLTCSPSSKDTNSGKLPLVEAAVVRPTIFKSDPNSPETTPPQPHPLNTNSQANPLSDGPQTPNTKINPLKSRFCTALSGARLDSPLGLQSLAIDDLALSASSYSNELVGPHMARLNLDTSGGAWCPIKAISGSNFGKEWIQVKLNRSFVITAIETQGRFAMGSGKEFVPSYQVEYSRNGGLSWHKWKDLRGLNLLRANEDVNSAVKNELSPPIVGANVIRILPYSQHLRTVCLRFELHGCLYDEGAPIAYSTNDGVVEPRWGHLIDYTYDGLRLRGLLSQGLGQLVDGVKGHDNFSFNNGFEWVGWKSMNGDVVIEFTFKTVRNFTGALFHSNNLFSSGVEVFQAVDVHYGIDVPLSMEALKDSLLEQRRRDAISRTNSKTLFNEDIQQSSIINNDQQQQQTTLWSPKPLNIEYEPDKKVENSRPVTVHLQQRLANKLRFVLKFASKWILVSEVEFLSHPVELLSLSSLSDQHTLPLMQALNPAKSYDEYIAILREHQLRRIAQNAYLNSLVNSSSSTSSNSPTTDVNSDQPRSSPDTSSTTSSIYEDYPNKLDSIVAGKRVTGPSIPFSNNIMWQAPTQADPTGPSTNPILNNPINNQLVPMLPSNPPNNNVSPTQGIDTFGNPIEFMVMNRNKGQGNDNNNILPQNTSIAGATPERRSIGIATVISSVFASILVLLGLLFAISSYRLRHQPKLGPPSSINNHIQARHLSTPGSSGKAGLVNPSLQSFMNVFSSSNSSSSPPPPPLPTTTTTVPDEMIIGANNRQRNGSNQYNAMFSTNGHRLNNGSDNNTSSMRATLKRLATLTGSCSSSARKHHQQTNSHNHNLFNNPHHQQASNQLLVSVKEPTTNQLFGNQMASGKGQTINTQLIVGFNQANPLAQQQIYNNSSNLNCSNQTYATHYSTSNSMASSSTNGADYAIPDAQPMIPSSQHHHHHSTMSPLVSMHHQRQQQHLNHAFNSGTTNFRHPNFNYQTELRASHRGNHAGHINQMGHDTTLVQTQQQVMEPMRPTEHNYELILQDQTYNAAPNVRPTLPNPHHRTLSNQLMTCQQQQQSQQVPFSATTLNNARLISGNNNEQQIKRVLPQVVAVEEASPGGNSSQSVATTTTSASSNNSLDINQTRGATSHYYYNNNK